MRPDDALTILGDPLAPLEARIDAAHALAAQGDPRVDAASPVAIPAGRLLHKPSAEVAATAIAIGAFAIGRHPVTVGEFGAFLREGGYDDSSWWSDEGWSWRVDESIESPRFWGETEWAAYLVSNHPVVGVSAYEAEAYAAFRGARLPTSHEWERAARGDDARAYPWGDAWDERACGHRDHGPRSTVPVGVFPSGASPFGVHDLCGSVWQWTSDERSISGTRQAQRVVRGGAWNNLPWSLGCAGTNAYPSDARFSNLGFRLAYDVR